MFPKTCVVVVAIFCAFLSAQSAVTTPFTGGGAGGRHTVRDAAGVLWTAYVQEQNNAGVITRPVLLSSSADSGVTWAPSSLVVNDATSGLNTPNGANGVNLAIDSTGRLHIVWSAAYYPTYYQSWYRNWHPTNSAGAILNLHTLAGATTASRSDASEVMVDAHDIVWLTTATSANWVSRLWYSLAPSALNNSFASVGNLQTSGSSQSPRLAVDATGLVHTFCYRNIGSGNFEHRSYSLLTGWSASTVLGNTTAPADYYGDAAADALGNVHALVFKDSQAGQTATWQVRHRIWNAATGWGPENFIADITSAQYTGLLSHRSAALAVEEGSGTAFVVLRDLAAGGQLRLLAKSLADPAFVVVSDLTAPSLLAHQYYQPSVRGRLWPASDRSGAMVDATWREGTAAANYTLNFASLAVPSAGATLLPDAPLLVGALTTLTLRAPSFANAPYIVAFSFANAPGMPLADGRIVPLNMDALFFMSLDPLNGVFINTMNVLDGTGNSLVGVMVPPLPILSGFNFYGAAVTLDPLSLSGAGGLTAATLLHIF